MTRQKMLLLFVVFSHFLSGISEVRLDFQSSSKFIMMFDKMLKILIFFNCMSESNAESRGLLFLLFFSSHWDS